MTRPSLDQLEVLSFASPAEWESWLEREHEASPGVWLRIAKKATGIATFCHWRCLRGSEPRKHRQ